MALHFTIAEKCTFKCKNKRILSKWISGTISAETDAKMGDISVVLCTDEELLKINREYLNHDYFTDIITFDYCESRVVAGDLMISVDTVKSNAKLFNVTTEQELHRIILHGVLHLLGYKDKSDIEQVEMRQKENFYLAKLEL